MAEVMTDTQATAKAFISWVHFGDLHIQNAEDENYLDFLDLITDVNQYLSGELDFAFLPGDNADDGTEPQYQLIRGALYRLMLPVHIITGDHDRKAGTLNLFQQYLERGLYRAVAVRGFRLLFLNALDGRTKKEFDFSTEQMAWLEQELKQANRDALRPLVFTHLYPSELMSQGKRFSQLIREFQVELVEMGHTHYNELANDGRTIYAATRSTGQIEEGPPGFSITAIDDDVVSWKFKERGPWPFVMITSPSDERLITRPESGTHVVRGLVPIRARVWGSSSLASVVCSVDQDAAQPMQLSGTCWEFSWNSQEVPDGLHSIVVRAETTEGGKASDEISILVNQAGHYHSQLRREIDYENAIGRYECKGILGTELGPNEKGTKGPWPSWRNK
jgi:Icc protein